MVHSPDNERLKDIQKLVGKMEKLGNLISKGKVTGEYRSIFRGAGIEFDRVREFSDLDDPKFIDWKVTARLGSPFVKLFQEERELNIYFLVDISASQNFGSSKWSKRDYAAEFCAIVGANALATNDKVGLLQFSDRVEKFLPARKGRKKLLMILREVLFATPESSLTNISSALEFFRKTTRSGCVVFLISDFLDRGFVEPLQRIAKYHDIYLVRIYDPLEEKFPDVGLLEMIDPETGEKRLVDTSTRSALGGNLDFDDLRQALLELRNKYRRLHFMEFDIGDNFEKKVRKFFRVETGR